MTRSTFSTFVPTIVAKNTFNTPKRKLLRAMKFIALCILLFAKHCEAIGGGSPSTGTQSHHPYDHNKDLEKLKTHAQTSPMKVTRRTSSSWDHRHGQGSRKSSMEADENASTGAADDDTSDVAKSRVVNDGFVRHSAAAIVTNILEVSEVIERSSVFDFDKDRLYGKDEKKIHMKTNQD